jgi:hypothetical protein
MIIKESKNFIIDNKENKRYIFISASKLQKFWKNVPKSILDSSLFFFGSKRHWLFPNSDEEINDSKNQPTDYLSFDKEFLNIIKEKEKRNEVFYLKSKDTEHAGDYNKVSDWLISNGLKPLWLSKDKWENNKNLVNNKNYYNVSIEKIIYNYETGNHFYDEVMALLKYSNEHLFPIVEF